MLKKIVHLLFVIIGGTLGFLYAPRLFEIAGIKDVPWLTSPYIGAVLGIIIFFLLSYFLAEYIVGFLKWVEEGLVKIPLVDLFLGFVVCCSSL